jgi:hypothetical protein
MDNIILKNVSPLNSNVADPDPACHSDAGPDPTFHYDADLDPDPSFQMKAQNLEKVLKYAHIPYILACHLQIDPDPDPAYHFDADPDSDPADHFDAELDPDSTLQFDADPCGSGSSTLVCCFVDWHRLDIDPDPNPNFHSDADSDQDPDWH